MHRLLLPLLFLTSACALADYPTNTIVLPEGVNPSGATKTSFTRAIKRAETAYAQTVQRLANCRLEITGDWADGTVNAYASRVGSVCKVEMFGGFARYGSMSTDALIGVICHEIGHHIGGDPKYARDWASCEGQSDYFAQTCMKKLLGNAPARIQRADVILADNLARMSRENKPSVLTPDETRANGIYCRHPRAQCRLDTYIAGMHGLPRPRCWYNP